MRSHSKLTAKFVASVSDPGRYADGGGLYLHVRKRSKTTERLWVFRFKRGGRGKVSEKTLSIGTARDVTLAQARETAGKCRSALSAGEDPRDVISRKRVPTFGKVADDLIDDIGPGLKSAKHVAQWRMTLGDTYCRQLRRIAVDQVRTEDVLAVLKPIWLTKPETASRIRGRIERVLDRAAVHKYRSGENPARWRGHLSHLLATQKGTKSHHAAMPWADVPAFLTQLRGLDSVSALALEWTILTVSRTSEAVKAKRSEIDANARVWTVPAIRMKAGREHRVPLCDRALAIYEESGLIGSDWLFPGRSNREPLSTAAMAECLKGFEVEATVHGFRSSFRDWVGEATSFPETLAEAALAHIVGDKTERAYKRGDALERRRKLMTAWERYLLAPSSNVVALRG